jgi:hypothetical protein
LGSTPATAETLHLKGNMLNVNENILPEAPLDLCTDILVIREYMVYILNSSFPLNPTLISMFHHPNLSKTLKGVLCKDAAKSCQENFILVCISPLPYLKLKKLLHDTPKKSASPRSALYIEYFYCRMEHCRVGSIICCHLL